MRNPRLVPGRGQRGPGRSRRPQSSETAVGAGRAGCPHGPAPQSRLQSGPAQAAEGPSPPRVQIARSGSVPFPELLPQRPRDPRRPGGPQAPPRAPPRAGPARGARARPRAAGGRLEGARGLHGDGRGDARPTPACGPRLRPPARLEAGGRAGGRARPAPARGAGPPPCSLRRRKGRARPGALCARPLSLTGAPRRRPASGPAAWGAGSPGRAPGSAFSSLCVPCVPRRLRWSPARLLVILRPRREDSFSLQPPILCHDSE